MMNQGVEIDTSPPFESVKEAVSFFSGRGSWNHPHQFFPLHDYQNTKGVFEIDKAEGQAAQFERLLIKRESETLNVLRELEEAKTLIEGLKSSLIQGQNSMLSLGDVALNSSVSNFEKTTATLNGTTADLSLIRSSVESLNKMMNQEKGVFGVRSEANLPNSALVFSAMDKDDIKIHPADSSSVSFTNPQFNFGAELVEASRYEIMKAMAEIERTTLSIRMAEMRLNAAKKIEEAAKAVEAIAFAETKTLLNGKKSLESHHHKPEEITLPFEEYREICKTKFMDCNGKYMNSNSSQCPVLRKLDQTAKDTCNEGDVYRNEFLDNAVATERTEYNKMRDAGHRSVKLKFMDSNSRNEHLLHPSTDKTDSSLLSEDEPNIAEDRTMPVYRSKISIGEILSRKLILQNDAMVGTNLEARGERQQRSLTQLFRQRGGHMLHRAKSMKYGSATQKKKFGFIHVPLCKHKQKKPRS